MIISYAICVCNESKDLFSLISFLLKVKDDKEKLLPLNNFIGSNFSYAVISFAVVSLYFTFPSFYRFPDYAPTAGHMISLYFGFLCLFALGLIRS